MFFRTIDNSYGEKTFRFDFYCISFTKIKSGKNESESYIEGSTEFRNFKDI